MKRLRKSHDKKIAGVCGGVSHYINPDLDPVIIRVITLVFGIFNPIVWITYLVLAIMLPDSEYSF
ncbi:PspC domain-containing protein [Prolixibacteraceae bacterium JC049]|nr:PspC domain-containing protein [Prolixibacteraceae bacterium JC049]